MRFKSRVINALSWVAFTQAFSVAFGLVVSVVLARVLAPDDFGLMALAASTVAVVSGFAELSFSALIIKNQEMSEEEHSSLFTVRLLLALVQSAILASMAPFLADYFGRAELTSVIRLLAFAIPVSALTMIPDAILRKQLEFRKLAIVNMVASAISGGIGIWMALSGFGYWSLVAQHLVTAGLSAILLRSICAWRPALSFDFAPLITNASYLLNNYGLNLVGVVVLQGDKLLLGKLLGISGLGIYMRALGFGQQIQGFVVGAAEQVAFPALAEHGDDIARVHERFLRIREAVCRIATPALAAVTLLAQPLIVFLFGQQWIEAAPILQLLSVGLLANTLGSPWGWLIMATGQVRILFQLSLLEGPIRLVTLAAGAMYADAIGAAWAYLASSVACVVLRVRILGKLTGISAGTYLSVLPHHLVLSLAAVVAGELVLTQLGNVAPLFQLVAAMTGGLLGYSLAMIMWYQLGKLLPSR